MKRLLTIVAILLGTVAIAQPPMQRPLPNQFRDFVDHQQNWQRPQVERKDGKVIITMTEQQFRMMQQRRMQMRRNMPGHPMKHSMKGCEHKKCMPLDKKF